MGKVRKDTEAIKSQIDLCREFILILLRKRPLPLNKIIEILIKDRRITSNWLSNKSKFRGRILQGLELEGEIFRLSYSKENKVTLKNLFNIDWEKGKDNAHYSFYYFSKQDVRKNNLLREAYKNRYQGVPCSMKSLKEIKKLK